jgi:hypothetical protein
MAEKKKTGLAKYLAAIRDTADEYGLYQTPSALNPLLRTFTPNNHAFSGEPSPVSRPESIHPGTLMMGQSPEEVQRWQEGNSPFMGKPSAEGAPVIRSIPGRSGNIASDAFRFKEDRTLPTLDTVLLGADIGGLAGLAGRGLRRGAQAVAPVLNPEMNVSRREFMGNTGKIAAGAAAAAVLPAALRGAEHAAPVVDRAAGHAAAATVKKATAEDYRWALHDAEKKMRDEWVAAAHPDELWSSYDKILERGQRFRREGHAAVRADPRFAEHAHLKTPDEIIEEWGKVNRKNPSVHTVRSSKAQKWIQAQIDSGNMTPLLPADKLYLRHMGLDEVPAPDIYLPNNYRKGGRVRMI